MRNVSWVRILVDSWEELLAAGLLGAIGCATVAQVVMRTVFAAPFEWTEELSQFLMVWASALGAVGAIKRMALVRVDYVLVRLSPLWRSVFDWVICIAVCGVLVSLGWSGWQLATRTSTVATTLPITWAWAYVAAPILAALAIARLLQLQVLGYRFAFFEVVVLQGRMAGSEIEVTSDPAGAQ